MFKINYLKDYYNLAKQEFGTTDDYSEGKTDIDFSCMIREKFNNSINKANKEITLSGRKISLNDLKTHLNNKLVIYENNAKYNSITLKVVLVTIAVNSIYQLVPSNSSFDLKVIGVFVALILALIIAPMIDFFEIAMHKSNTGLIGFYKISLDVLEQVIA